MEHQSASARLFIACTPPLAVRQQLAVLLHDAPLPAGWRCLEPDGWHVTLRFLGDVAVAGIPELTATLTRLTRDHPVMTVQLTGWGAFPTHGRARVLWIGVQEIGSNALHKLARQLALLPPPADPRPFHPHLTLARTRHATDLTPTLPNLPEFSAEWEITELHLIRSFLRPDGAGYACIHSTGLICPYKPAQQMSS